MAARQLEETRDVALHLVKEGIVLDRNSKSKKEVKKGMQQKAEQGMYPGHAAFGYCYDKLARTIVIDPEKSRIVKRIFEAYDRGAYSTHTSCRAALINACPDTNLRPA